MTLTLLSIASVAAPGPKLCRDCKWVERGQWEASNSPTYDIARYVAWAETPCQAAARLMMSLQPGWYFKRNWTL